VKGLRSLLGADDGDVDGKVGVERLGRRGRIRTALDLDRDHVRERVHARIRPAGDCEAPSGGIDRRKRLAEGTLDRPLAGLARPAPEGGAVVGNR
jgi:hypothetical protein